MRLFFFAWSGHQEGWGKLWGTCVFFLTFAFALLLDCTKINFVTYQLLLTATSQCKDVFSSPGMGKEC